MIDGRNIHLDGGRAGHAGRAPGKRTLMASVLLATISFVLEIFWGGW